MLKNLKQERLRAAANGFERMSRIGLRQLSDEFFWSCFLCSERKDACSHRVNGFYVTVKWPVIEVGWLPHNDIPKPLFGAANTVSLDQNSSR